jgi:hypothetical protein
VTLLASPVCPASVPSGVACGSSALNLRRQGSMTLSQKAASFAANAGSAHFGEGAFGRGHHSALLTAK